MEAMILSHEKPQKQTKNKKTKKAPIKYIFLAVFLLAALLVLSHVRRRCKRLLCGYVMSYIYPTLVIYISDLLKFEAKIIKVKLGSRIFIGPI